MTKKPKNSQNNRKVTTSLPQSYHKVTTKLPKSPKSTKMLRFRRELTRKRIDCTIKSRE